MNQRGLTDRQRIIEELKGKMLTAREISQAVGIKEKEVLEHLPHVAKSVPSYEGGGYRFMVEHPLCMDCGFAFSKRDRLKTPSRCPVCRSEAIRETRFGIEKNTI